MTRCLVTDNSRTRDQTNPYKIELKSFIVEWRILNKAYTQKQIQLKRSEKSPVNVDRNEKSTDNKSVSPNRSKSPELNKSQNRLTKKDIQKQIKKVLITSMRLKMKLKEQVESLKNNVIIQENVIVQHLKNIK